MALQLMHKHCPTLHIDVNLRDTINFDVTLCPRLELYGSVVVILGVFVWGVIACVAMLIFCTQQTSFT